MCTVKGILNNDSALADLLQSYAVLLYATAAEYSLSKGIILADTKFEFGLLGDSNELILVDECLTPDSSRFWPLAEYGEGNRMVGFDKQFLREFLKSRDSSFGDSKEEEGITIPEQVVVQTFSKYEEAYLLLTGIPFAPL